MSKGNNFFKLEVPYFSQLDNVYAPFISCYPTSMAMAMNYCLLQEGKDKKDIGCPYDIQLEDFINKITMSSITQRWLKLNAGRLGSWIWKYRPRTIAYVEEHIFNTLMMGHGYKCKFKTEVSFDEYCNIIDEQKLPQVVHGNFSKKTRVNGHIICGIGYNKISKEIIANDPFGNAKTKFINQNGQDVEYYFDETSGNSGGSDSGWQNSPEFIDEGLQAGMTYTYRVRSRDKSQNQNTTGGSSSEQITISPIAPVITPRKSRRLIFCLSLILSSKIFYHQVI